MGYPQKNKASAMSVMDSIAIIFVRYLSQLRKSFVSL